MDVHSNQYVHGFVLDVAKRGKFSAAATSTTSDTGSSSFALDASRLAEPTLVYHKPMYKLERTTLVYKLALKCNSSLKISKMVFIWALY